MSLICDQILSEDELSQPSLNQRSDEELDYEEEIHEKEDSDKDEGELDDDDDLEEGEVKEDDDEDDQRRPKKDTETPNNRQNSVCRFYGRGQCTWGNNCRFVHPSGALPAKRPPPPPPAPMPPIRRREFQYDQNESAWERGLKQAKEMIVRASRRKEEEMDFEDKRFNLGAPEEAVRRSSSPERFDMNLDDYERRRRLAFESAPWNNEEPVGARMRAAETYRDPWRRSKSPPAAATKFRRPVGAKRSHSMSSISASGSESSDFSGSEGSSFSESSGSDQGRRFEKKKTKRVVPPVANWTPKEETKEEYDSWSESLSDSESMSSYYSGSDSEDNKRIPKRPNKGQPPTKRPKVATKSPPKVPKDTKDEKKSPIKMTFLKKQSNLKTSSVAVKLNGGRNEDQIPEEEDELQSPEMSPKTIGPKSISSASPVSQEAPSPRPPPPQSSSSSSGSSKFDKSLSATVSRREELLQQLKAVEDAIARKRSKIN